MAPTSRNGGGIGGGGGTSVTGGSSGGWGDASLARALFAYLSSGENQLSFLEGDLIALMGLLKIYNNFLYLIDICISKLFFYIFFLLFFP